MILSILAVGQGFPPAMFTRFWANCWSRAHISYLLFGV